MSKAGYGHANFDMSDARCVDDVDFNPYCYRRAKAAATLHAKGTPTIENARVIGQRSNLGQQGFSRPSFNQSVATAHQNHLGTAAWIGGWHGSCRADWRGRRILNMTIDFKHILTVAALVALHAGPALAGGDQYGTWNDTSSSQGAMGSQIVNGQINLQNNWSNLTGNVDTIGGNVVARGSAGGNLIDITTMNNTRVLNDQFVGPNSTLARTSPLTLTMSGAA